MALRHLMHRLLGPGSDAEAEFYRCAECDATFKSSEPPERTRCPICLSTAVSQVWAPDPQV